MKPMYGRSETEEILKGDWNGIDVRSRVTEWDESVVGVRPKSNRCWLEEIPMWVYETDYQVRGICCSMFERAVQALFDKCKAEAWAHDWDLRKTQHDYTHVSRKCVTVHIDEQCKKIMHWNDDGVCVT